MDEATYNQTLNDNEGLIRTIVRAGGFSGADADELVQDIKLAFWKTRNKKRTTDSDKAYLIGIARKTVQMALRREGRMKRDAPVFGFDERDTSEFSSGTINGKEIFKSADQERLVDQNRLAEDLIAFAGLLRPAHESVVLNRLKADEEEVRAPTAVNRVGMLRESRRLLNLPEDDPRRVEVTNPAARVARVVKEAGRRQSPQRAEVTRVTRHVVRKEPACATANSQTIVKKSRDDATTQVQPPRFDLSSESSTPSFSMKIGRQRTNNEASRTFGRKPLSAFTPPKSACGRSTTSTSARDRSLRQAGDVLATCPTYRRRATTMLVATMRSLTNPLNRGSTPSAR